MLSGRSFGELQFLKEMGELAPIHFNAWLNLDEVLALNASECEVRAQAFNAGAGGATVRAMGE